MRRPPGALGHVSRSSVDLDGDPRPQPARRHALAWAAVVAAGWALLAALSLVLALLDRTGEAAVVAVIGVAASAPSVVLGLVVARRRPDNAVGPLLAAAGLVVVGTGVTDLYGLVVERRPGLLPATEAYVPLAEGAWMWMYVPLALLMLVFPDGRFLSPRWRWVAVALLGVVVAFGVLVAGAPRPYAAPNEDAPHALGTLPGWALPAALALLPVFLGLLVACAASMAVRYRRAADAVQQAQLKWLALAATLLPLTLLLCWLSILLLGDTDLVVIGLAALVVGVPVATTVAMLRHDLYDVDRVLSGTVTYAVTSAALLGVFTVVSVLGGLAVGGRSATVAAVATAVAAAALAPLRSRIQLRVDRRLYPARDAALRALADLRHRTHTGEARPEELEATLRTALRDPDLQVGYRLPSRPGLVDAAGGGIAADEARVTPVLLGGEQIGVLVSTRLSRDLLRVVADAAGLLVEVVRLRVEVTRALAEAESSRARLLHAGYDERRRLERDLHDGAQQRLVSLGMALRLAQRHLDDGTVDVDGLLDQAVAELGTAVAELRTLAHGLRPSTLDDGLAPALSALTRGVPVVVDLQIEADHLPDDVATTAYYVACEALANSVKHAGAARIGLRVARQDGVVAVLVSDDGIGGAAARTGSGLAGLADRVAAAGGRLSVRSPAGSGTVVEAVLPCAS